MATTATAAPRATVPLSGDREIVLDVEELARQSRERAKHASHWRYDLAMAALLAGAMWFVICFCMIFTLSLSESALKTLIMLECGQIAMLVVFAGTWFVLMHRHARHYRSRAMFYVALASGLYSLGVLLFWLIHLGWHLLERAPVVWALCYTAPLAMSVLAHLWLVVACASLADLSHGYALTTGILRDAAQALGAESGSANGVARKSD